MKMKKLMSLAMALIMAAALAAPALATSTYSNVDSSELTFTGGTKSATLQLQVASSAALIFNPYKLKAKMTNETGVLDTTTTAVNTATQTIVQDQIISKPFAINNQTEVPIRVGIILGVDTYQDDGDKFVENGIGVVSAAPAATITAKQVYVYADFAVFDGGSDPDTAKRTDAWFQKLTATKATVTADYSASTAADKRVWDGKTGGKLVVTKNAGGIYVPAPTVAASSTDTTPTNTLYVKLGGAATAAPEESWSTQDKVDVHLAMTFQANASAPLYKVYMANYYAATDAESLPTYSAGVKVGTDATASGTDGKPTLTIPYTSAVVNVDAATANAGNTAPLWKPSKEEQVEGTIEANYVVTINPAKDNNGKVTHTITSVNFYDANGVKLTTPKAVSTNTKDKAAPWTFTMPAQNVVIDIVVTSTGTT